jgi:hypothetical protein
VAPFSAPVVLPGLIDQQMGPGIISPQQQALAIQQLQMQLGLQIAQQQTAVQGGFSPMNSPFGNQMFQQDPNQLFLQQQLALALQNNKLAQDQGDLASLHRMLQAQIQQLQSEVQSSAPSHQFGHMNVQPPVDQNAILALLQRQQQMTQTFPQQLGPPPAVGYSGLPQNQQQPNQLPFFSHMNQPQHTQSTLPTTPPGTFSPVPGVPLPIAPVDQPKGRHDDRGHAVRPISQKPRQKTYRHKDLWSVDSLKEYGVVVNVITNSIRRDEAVVNSLYFDFSLQVICISLRRDLFQFEV